MLLLSSAGFFPILLFQKILSGTLSEYQTVWIQIRTDVNKFVNKNSKSKLKVGANMDIFPL